MSPELAQARCGYITASKMGDMLAEGKGVTRAKYCAQLAAERLSGKPHRNGFTNSAMDHGNEFEIIAKMHYELTHAVEVTSIDFVPHPHIKMAGASPDGAVDDDGLIEIKCPDTHTFFQYKMSGEIPRKYRLQMLWQLACTGRKWNDFFAYDPDLPIEDGTFLVRLIPTAKEIADLEFEVIKFNLEVEAMMQRFIELRCL